MKHLFTLIYHYLYTRPFHSLAPRKICSVMDAVLLAVITFAILYYTLLERSVHAARTAAWLPFWSIRNRHWRDAWLNAFLFLPLGLSLPYLLPDRIRHRAAATVLTAAVFSMLIEAIQFVFMLGLCETDDVIMNTLGAAVGTVSFLVVEHIRRKTNTQSIQK